MGKDNSSSSPKTLTSEIQALWLSTVSQEMATSLQLSLSKAAMRLLAPANSVVYTGVTAPELVPLKTVQLANAQSAGCEKSTPQLT
jgi:hypothetical protein